ncbi:MAG: ABC transporter permease [Peptoniphilaceae bacterium]|nr:ABC transporter permease [Peptoniphilaceae bacterium]MDY5766608.1 ABC transporter permease [Peptoniphilaceae bacterium]
MKIYKRLSAPYMTWAILFVIIPMAMILYYALTDDSGAISLINFHVFFSGNSLITLFKSIRIAIISTVICFLLGYPMAYFMARSHWRFRPVLMMLIVIPMWMNFLLRTYSWITLLSRHGILNTFLESLGIPAWDLLYTEGAVILGMVYNFLPFMVLPIYTSLEKMDKRLLEAASDLGASRLRVFTNITLPLSVPGILSGLSMVFIPAISTFEITMLLGGNKTNLIGNVIEQQFTVTGNWHYGSSMAVILMIFLVISLFFSSGTEAKDPQSMTLADDIDSDVPDETEEADHVEMD